MNSNRIEYICGTSRVDNDETLLEEIKDIQPTHVVSFIGRTHGTIGEKVYTTIDYLEQEGKLVENMRDNLYANFKNEFISIFKWSKNLNDRNQLYYICEECTIIN